MHKVIEQTGHIFEAIGGNCQRDASMGAKLLHALGFKNDDIGVLHGKLCRLTTQFAYLVNAKNLTTKQVCDLLEILPSAEGREYHYRASDNKRTLWKPSISDNPYKSTCSKDEKSRSEESASTSAVTSVTPASENPCVTQITDAGLQDQTDGLAEAPNKHHRHVKNRYYKKANTRSTPSSKNSA